MFKNPQHKYILDIFILGNKAVLDIQQRKFMPLLFIMEGKGGRREGGRAGSRREREREGEETRE